MKFKVKISTLIIAAIISTVGFSNVVNAENKVVKKIKDSQVVIQHKKNISKKEINSLETKYNVRYIKENKNGLCLVKVKNPRKLDNVLEELRKEKCVEFAEPNYIRKSQSISKEILNDTRAEEQWGLEAVNAPKAWSILQSADKLNDITVAVVDTGMDLQHEDLKDSILSNGYDFIDDDSDPMDKDGTEVHATHVAGIIAAGSNNNLGISGAVGKLPIKIMPIRVMNAEEGTDFSISQGIRYAVDNGAKVINMSLTGPGDSKPAAEAVKYALSKNIVVVSASGNDGANADNYSPSNLDGVITVTAVNYKKEFADFSNTGECVDIAAPGEDILSCIPQNQYEYSSGTSMAAPFVSATAAMMLSQNTNLLNTEISDVLYKTAKDFGEVGKDNYFGYGLLDMQKAIEQSQVQKDLSININ